MALTCPTLKCWFQSRIIKPSLNVWKILSLARVVMKNWTCTTIGGNKKQQRGKMNLASSAGGRLVSQALLYLINMNLLFLSWVIRLFLIVWKILSLARVVMKNWTCTTIGGNKKQQRGKMNLASSAGGRMVSQALFYLINMNLLFRVNYVWEKYHVKKVVGFSNKATRTGIMAIILILL